ncbi:ATP-dependent endonuclease [Dyadobacter sp. CY343]|uniref:ATP-dependent nuclease n=1 Tax=Dyadobacter sp. CY343 TaxID=2907299 RepID=UPI001F40254F|nr:AAA family ATPase [Dyadobacter sp. CY343]MCE7061936.1 AAA family ATPase [Dyadobacter sp. CY343]
MYLKIFKIRRFRAIKNLEITFNQGLNVIIGENSSGKTAIIDALRICLGYGSQWRQIGVRNDEDFFIDTNNIDCVPEPIEFDLHFCIQDDEEPHLFNSMLWQDPADPTKQELQMHFRYILEQTPTGATKMRWNVWGGDLPGQLINPNEAELIYFNYLAPLRNAEQELRPYARDNKITSLFKDLTSYSVVDDQGNSTTHSLDRAKKDALASQIEQVTQDVDWKNLIATGTARVNEHLEKADIRSKSSKIHLRLLEYRYENIIKGIITRKPVFAPNLLPVGQEHKQRFFDVSQNGLGENNLIFASAVLGDLKNRRAEKKEHYYSLLIEEPEAHLHPQRQNTFFNYLNELKEHSLQVFMTSHSPTLTAKSDLDHLIVIQKNEFLVPFTVKNSDLTDENKRHLRKFLDVTKSQLFFSSGTILVEGISEALLLPVLAEIIDMKYNLDKSGIEIVNISGIAFEPFARLYNSPDPLRRLPSRCSILTDDDRGNLAATHFISEAEGINKEVANKIYSHLIVDGVVDSSNRIIAGAYNFDHAALNHYSAYVNHIIDNRRSAISGRASNATGLRRGNLKVELAAYTFEYELMIASELNYRLMMWIYRKMHPRTTFLSIAELLSSRALDFVAKLDANKDKSVFAEHLSQALVGKVLRRRFVVPDYITRSITWVVDGN